MTERSGRPRHGTDSQLAVDSDEAECPGGEARISVDLGALCVETQAETLDDAEQAFYRVWEHVMDDMDEMTDAMRERLGGYQ